LFSLSSDPKVDRLFSSFFSFVKCIFLARRVVIFFPNNNNLLFFKQRLGDCCEIVRCDFAPLFFRCPPRLLDSFSFPPSEQPTPPPHNCPAKHSSLPPCHPSPGQFTLPDHVSSYLSRIVVCLIEERTPSFFRAIPLTIRSWELQAAFVDSPRQISLISRTPPWSRGEPILISFQSGKFIPSFFFSDCRLVRFFPILPPQCKAYATEDTLHVFG